MCIYIYVCVCVCVYHALSLRAFINLIHVSLGEDIYSSVYSKVYVYMHITVVAACSPSEPSVNLIHVSIGEAISE